MRKNLILIENDKGNFNIRDFGPHIAGQDGKDTFDLTIRSADQKINVIFSNINIAELFTRFDIKGKHFKAGVYFSIDFIEVGKDASQVCLVITKTLFSLFKTASVDGRLQIKSEIPLTVTDGANFKKYQKTSSKAKAA